MGVEVRASPVPVPIRAPLGPLQPPQLHLRHGTSPALRPAMAGARAPRGAGGGQRVAPAPRQPQGDSRCPLGRPLPLPLLQLLLHFGVQPVPLLLGHAAELDSCEERRRRRRWRTRMPHACSRVYACTGLAPRDLHNRGTGAFRPHTRAAAAPAAPLPPGAPTAPPLPPGDTAAPWGVLQSPGSHGSHGSTAGWERG